MLKRARRQLRILATLVLLALAIAGGVFLWNHYLVGPWTRDGEVRANVVNMAPEISGRIVAVDVRDNEFVRKGTVLYEIDPLDYQIAIAQAKSNVAARQANLELQNAEARRRGKLSSLSASEEEVQTHLADAEQARAAYESAIAGLAQAQANLQRATIRSPVNGYVTNLLVQKGDYATAGARNIAVVDSDSFWVTGYFEETKLHGIHVGDRAEILLMGFDQPIHGTVESIARGISSPNYAPGTLGLASVNPVFTWVRLAQRIPVHIRIDTVPKGVLLVAGETATVTVGNGGAGWFPARGWLSRLF